MNASDPAMETPVLEAMQLEVSIGGHQVCRNLDWRVGSGESCPRWPACAHSKAAD
jgi:hypothetical protein